MIKKTLYLIFFLLGINLCTSTTKRSEKIIGSMIVGGTLILKVKKSLPPCNQRLSTRLCNAINQQNDWLAEYLITNNKVDVNGRMDYVTSFYIIKNCTGLIMCCDKGDKSLKILDTLLSHKDINVNAKAEGGLTPLAWGCWKGDTSLKIVRSLLSHKDIDVNVRGKHGNTPLLWGCIQGDNAYKVIRLVLRHPSIDIGAQNSNDKKNALHYACISGAINIVQLLLDYVGIEKILHQQDGDGKTPLDEIFEIIAIEGAYSPPTRYTHIWSMLIAKGAMLQKYIKEYKRLVPKKFKKNHQGYVQYIKNTPPISYRLNSYATDSNLINNSTKNSYTTYAKHFPPIYTRS